MQKLVILLITLLLNLGLVKSTYASGPGAAWPYYRVISCGGVSDKLILIRVNSGISPYYYSISDGITWLLSETDPYPNGILIANKAYKIRIKDSAGCESPVIP